MRNYSMIPAVAALSTMFFAAGQSGSLELRKPITRSIRAGETHRYAVAARTGEMIRGRVLQEGTPVNIRGFFPDGSKIRSFAGASKGAKNFRFVAEAAGTYHLEITGIEGGRAEGQYTITLEQIQPLPARLSIAAPEQYASPRLAALKKELESAPGDAVSRFWERVAKEGTPLAEPLPGDERHLLVTFLWRAAFETHNVLVLWLPYSVEHPDDYSMVNLAGSDVWYKTLRVPRGARFLYQLSPNDTLSRSPNAQRYATAQADPLNPRRRPADRNITKYEAASIAELPGAAAQPWSDPRPGIAEGQVRKHRVASAILGNERDVFVYTPAGYRQGGGPYAAALLFDDTTYRVDVPAPTILDNLIAERKIPPTVAILIGYPTEDARNRELFGNAEFADFVATELMPWAEREYGVSRDPAKTVIGGLSAGGVAAAYIALKHSEVFGAVLAQSGAFWWSPKRDEGEEPNWLAREYARAPRLGLRFYLEAGLFENDVRGSGGQILEESRHLRDVLRAKGYAVEYREFPGGHDYLHWRGSLADALIALMAIRR